MAESKDFEILPEFSNNHILEQEAECKYLRSKVNHLEIQNKNLNAQLLNNLSKNTHISSHDFETLLEENKSLLTQLNQKNNIISEMQKDIITQKNEHTEEILKLKKLLDLKAPLNNLDLENSESSENSVTLGDGLRQAVQFAIQQQKELEKLNMTIATQNKKICNLYDQLKTKPVVQSVPLNNTVLNENQTKPEQISDAPFLITSELDDSTRIVNNGPPPMTYEVDIPLPQPADDDLPNNICPICNKSMGISTEEFELHVQICFSEHSIESPDSKVCPVCYFEFDIMYKQADFEHHVERHFNQTEDDIRVLA